MPSGACVIRYEGARGVSWRIKYADADGRQVMETVGAERDGVTRKQAEAELRERLVRVERKGYHEAEAADVRRVRRDVVRGGPAVAGLEAAHDQVYRNAIDAYLEPWFGSTRLGRRSGRVTCRRSSPTR